MPVNCTASGISGAWLWNVRASWFGLTALPHDLLPQLPVDLRACFFFFFVPVALMTKARAKAGGKMSLEGAS